MAETSQMAVIRKAIDVGGIVQGVGFRPFVYRLANACGLIGFIANTLAGVSFWTGCQKKFRRWQR
jgi:hydrogenase maturation protein HypF